MVAPMSDTWTPPTVTIERDVVDRVVMDLRSAADTMHYRNPLDDGGAISNALGDVLRDTATALRSMADDIERATREAAG